MTPSEMAQKSNANRTPEQRAKAARKARKTLLKKFGPNYYKEIRAGKKPRVKKQTV